MVLFKKKLKPGDHEIQKEGTEEVMHLNYEGCREVPSIEDDSITMSRVIEKLAQTPSVGRIVFHQNKKYEYGSNQTLMLKEISGIYNYLIKQKSILTQAALNVFGGLPDANEKLRNIQYIVLNLLKTDPIGAYVETKRLLREVKITEQKLIDEPAKESLKAYVETLNELALLLSNTKLIKYADEYIQGYVIGSRDVYKAVFRPLIIPDFMNTRLMATPPLDAEELDSYKVGRNNHIQIYNLKNNIKQLYHLIPPESQLSEDKYDLLELARKVLAEHQPKAEEFLDTERMRETFFSIGRDLITELAEHKKIYLDYDEVRELAEVLVRSTVGFGLIEVLLQDENVQDISINSPPGSTPIFVVHGIYGECVTNITPSSEDVESWGSKFRLVSARPLDEANPVLDTELLIPGARARVAAISRPLNPTGLAFSIRRHRDKPWSLPLFIKNGMISDLGAGLLSFLIQGSRSFLIAGTRGSGKTSLLGSVLVEIMRRYRIILLEDTLELPSEALRGLGYNLQSMKVRSALTTSGSEIAADEGIRVSLRMGDSALIVGEIRSLESLALFEAMRTGALANVVAGTIHGDSPYGVFDRLTNDLKVPKTSFKATDIIIVSNPVRSSDGLHSKRRIMSITEVRKEWEDDPLRERGFVDLMKYNAETDQLEPTEELLNGDSDVLKAIGGQIKEFSGSWEAIWKNIELRAKIKRTIVDYAEKTGIMDLLEADDVISMNDEFHRISDSVRTKVGFLDNERIFFEWEEAFKRYIRLKYQQ